MSEHPHLTASSHPKRNWYLTVLIVGSTLFAVGGVFRALFYGPVHARWLVAHAANELAAQRVDSAVSWLDKAYSSSADITSDHDYWRLRFEILSGKNPLPADELEQFVAQAVESINNDANQAYRNDVASRLSQLLFNETYFKQALTVLEKTLPPLEQRTASENNEIAYTRSIAEQDLDVALSEINRALQDPSTTRFSQFFDTKAWILFKKGESEKALKFANAAIKEWYREIAAANAAYALLLLPDDEFSLVKNKDGFPFPLPFFDESPIDEPSTSKSLETSVGLNQNPQSKEPVVRINPLLEKELFRPKSSAPDSDSTSDGESDNLATKTPKQSGGIGRDRGSPLHTTAVLRYHRACILDDLGKYQLAQKDYFWLHTFGFTKDSDLY
ncbi:MAG: hypothetical protein MUC43_02965 [Pirellula sp.]|jgi:tetratricopeptide (TPR) repeat protein|nr:hypothetical protein [Pirellula sp.]